jgi:hypothetical protein
MVDSSLSDSVHSVTSCSTPSSSWCPWCLGGNNRVLFRSRPAFRPWTLDLGLFESRPDCRAGSPLNGSTLGGSTLGGSTLTGGTTLWRPPYIKCCGTVTAGPLLGGPGGTTCPGAPGIISPSALSAKKGSPPRRGSFLVPRARAGLRRAHSGPVRGDRIPSRSTLDIGRWTVCALRAHANARAEIRSLHSATKPRFVQEQFLRFLTPGRPRRTPASNRGVRSWPTLAWPSCGTAPERTGLI